jgi:hypothetical protein
LLQPTAVTAARLRSNSGELPLHSPLFHHPASHHSPAKLSRTSPLPPCHQSAVPITGRITVRREQPGHRTDGPRRPCRPPLEAPLRAESIHGRSADGGGLWLRQSPSRAASLVCPMGAGGGRKEGEERIRWAKPTVAHRFKFKSGWALWCGPAQLAAAAAARFGPEQPGETQCCLIFFRKLLGTRK